MSILVAWPGNNALVCLEAYVTVRSAGKAASMAEITTTCSEYRGERLLLALKLELERGGLSPERRGEILAQIAELERQLGMD